MAKPVEGVVDVHTVLTDVAATAPIEKPAAEDLAMRQRTCPSSRSSCGASGRRARWLNRRGRAPSEAGAARAVRPRAGAAEDGRDGARGKGSRMSDGERPRPQLVTTTPRGGREPGRASRISPTTAA